MPSSTTLLLIVVCFLVLIPSVSAFGAGEIPDYAYLNDKAFRHLDIENILENIARWRGSRSGGGGGLLGAAVGLLASGGGDVKFTKADVHRVYFGNWLRDYSQAMDIAGLSKATKETIILLLSVLSFMTFGYVTEEFELKAERLGVYLPVEHIDNPKGYGGTDDPRKFHPNLRPPVRDEELQIDQRTGMKNYIANDGHGWDTSAAHVRRSLEKAIQLARQSGGHRSPELYEAYRLMGGALHTLEDLLAHSNWLELTFTKLGHRDVFCHVGDGVTVNAPGGQRVPPLVTGTFGSADFIFSVMGEAGDKLSESSISELSKKVEDAHGKQNQLALVKQLLSQASSSGADTEAEIQKAEQIQAQAYHFDPDHYTTEEVQKTLWDILQWRDQTMRKISTAIEKIPGLQTVMDQLTEALNVYIYTTIEPYVKPVLGNACDALGTGSRAVIDQDDQYEVFDNSNASDPSHSMLSKDHFDNILNEPAGKVAKVVVEVAVNKIVAAWSDDSVDVRRTIDEILEAFHHPYFANERSEMQMAMAQTAQKWLNGLGGDQRETLSRLTKEAVRDGRNKRLGADENTPLHSHTVGANQRRGGKGGHNTYGGGQSQGGGGYGRQGQQQQQQYSSGGGYGQSQRQEYGGGNDNSYGGGNRNQSQSQQYGGGAAGGYGGSGGYGRQEQSPYGHQSQQRQERTGGYGQQESGGYGGGGNDHQRSSYGQSTGYGGGGASSYGQSTRYGQEQESTGYGSQSNRRKDDDNENNYGRRKHDDDDNSYGRRKPDDDNNNYGRRKNDDDHPYGRRKDDGDDNSHGRRKHDDDDNNYGRRKHDDDDNSYGRRKHDDDDNSYGRRKHDDDDDDSHGRRKHDNDHGQSSYGGGGSYGQSSRRGGDDTYGVERLNIGESGGRRGYGGDEYGQRRRGDDNDSGRY